MHRPNRFGNLPGPEKPYLNGPTGQTLRRDKTSCEMALPNQKISHFDAIIESFTSRSELLGNLPQLVAFGFLRATGWPAQAALPEVRKLPFHQCLRNLV